jgi:cobyrinic acid a,c-diamide synthase
MEHRYREKRMISVPRIVIAGTHSGCGKTTVTRGIMAALRARGLIVQPFKVGPDFIDPSHHTRICGRPSRNLDPYMMGEDGVLETFRRASRGADIAVIEGVMGMFDGFEGTDLSSTAHVMRILSAPAVLVVDTKGMSRSANAVIRGYRSFDPGADIQSVIFNRVGSEHHRQMIETSREIPALGWLRSRDEIAVESRHLGLKMGIETEDSLFQAPFFEEAVDIDALISLARSAPPLAECIMTESPVPENSPVIGVANDEAFCFSYQDNLDRLQEAGGRIRFFSPVHDPLPPCDALYICGGYPEIHAAALEKSVCRNQIREAADAGMPIYAECGGLIYLTEFLTGVDEREYRMTGILPGTTEMTGRVQALGYTRGSCITPVSGLMSGDAIIGHEFHYSRIYCDPGAQFAISLHRGKGIRDGSDGMYEHNTIGTYMHAYFSRDFACQLVRSADKNRK